MERNSLASVKRQFETLSTGAEHHQQILAKLFHAIDSGDASSVQSCLTDDCEFVIAGWPALDGTSRGNKQTALAIIKNFSQITEQKTAVAATIHQGDMAAMRLHETGRLGGTPYQTQGVIWFKFEGDLISSIDEVLVTN